MSTPIQPAPTTNYTVQNIDNLSFDKDFGVAAIELLAYDATNQVLRRVLVDANGNLMISPSSTFIFPVGGFKMTDSGGRQWTVTISTLGVITTA